MTRPPEVDATEQDARNATVAQVGLSRRAVLIGAAGVAATATGTWLTIAASRNAFPFKAPSGASGPTTTEQGASGEQSVGELAEQLSSSSAPHRQAAVGELAARATSQRSDRHAACVALTAFLNDKRRPNSVDPATGKGPAEVSIAFAALGKAHLTDDAPDLRYAILSGVDVSHLDFRTGLPLYGANLDGASITDSTIGPSNVGDVSVKSGWLGGCKISGWNLVGAQLQRLQAPGTEFSSCAFAGADLTGANFETSTFSGCDFTGASLNEPYRGDLAKWDEGSPPTWPEGFVPF